MFRWMFVCVALAVCAGCDDGGDAGGPTPDAGTVAGTIGPEGGTLEAGGAQLTVPAGALAEATALTVSETAAAPVGPWQRLSPVYRFGPDGTTFAAPVTVRITFTGGAGAPTLFWTEGDGFAAVPGARVDGDAVVAEVTHFSEGFVGVPGAPDGGPIADGGLADDAAPGDAATPPADGGVDVDAGAPPAGGPLQPSAAVALGSEDQHDLSLKRALPAPGGQVTALFTYNGQPDLGDGPLPGPQGGAVVATWDAALVLQGRFTLAGRATDLVRAPDGDLIVLGQPLRKVAADGAERWNRFFNRDGSVDTAQGVAVDAAGRLHVVGLFDGEETFGGDTFQSQSGNTAFYAIFGADGGHVASAAYGGEHSTVLDRVVGLPEGGVVVAGTYTGDDVDFGGGLLPAPERVAFDRRVVLARLDDPATHRWSVGLDFGQRAPQVQALERAADGDLLLWVSMNTAAGLDLGTGVVTDVPGPAQLLIRVGADDGAVKAVDALVGAQLITPGVGRAGGAWCVAGTASRRIVAGSVELGPMDPMTQAPSGFALVLDDAATGGAAFDVAFPLPGPPDFRLDQIEGQACAPDGASGLYWFGGYRGMVDLAGPLPAGTQNRRPFLARLTP